MRTYGLAMMVGIGLALGVHAQSGTKATGELSIGEQTVEVKSWALIGYDPRSASVRVALFSFPITPADTARLNEAGGRFGAWQRALEEISAGKPQPATYAVLQLLFNSNAEVYREKDVRQGVLFVYHLANTDGKAVPSNIKDPAAVKRLMFHTGSRKLELRMDLPATQDSNLKLRLECR